MSHSTALAITMLVADPQRAKSFYGKAFDVESVYEDDHSIAFKFESMIVNLLVAKEAHELIAPAVVAEQNSGSRFQLTIWVDDTDAACEELGRREVELLNGPIDRPWGMRTAAFADPDGHIWELAAKIPTRFTAARSSTPFVDAAFGLDIDCSAAARSASRDCGHVSAARFRAFARAGSQTSRRQSCRVCFAPRMRG